MISDAANCEGFFGRRPVDQRFVGEAIRIDQGPANQYLNSILRLVVTHKALTNRRCLPRCDERNSRPPLFLATHSLQPLPSFSPPTRKVGAARAFPSQGDLLLLSRTALEHRIDGKGEHEPNMQACRRKKLFLNVDKGRMPALARESRHPNSFHDKPSAIYRQETKSASCKSCCFVMETNVLAGELLNVSGRGWRLRLSPRDPIERSRLRS